MTCIVGVAEGGNVWIGGDSAGVADLTLTRRRDVKVFRNGPFIMGFTTSFRMGQLLARSFTPPKRHPDQDIYTYMVTDFIDAVRDCLKKGGYAETHDGAERGGTFLVGYEGRLFNIEQDYQVGEALCNYDAIGCGASYAIGALYASHNEAPSMRVGVALDAAAEFSAGVRGPFEIISLNEIA